MIRIPEGPELDPGALHSCAARFGSRFAPESLDERTAIRKAFKRILKEMRIRHGRISTLRFGRDDITDLISLTLLFYALFELVGTRARDDDQESLYWDLLRRFSV